MTDIDTLIRDLEAATEGSRELDARVWCAAKGFEFKEAHRSLNDPRMKSGCFWFVDPTGQAKTEYEGGEYSRGDEWDLTHYTASLDAALTLVERGEWWSLCVNLDDRSISEAEVGGCSGDNPGHAPTPALAICIAAFKARSAP